MRCRGALSAPRSWLRPARRSARSATAVVVTLLTQVTELLAPLLELLLHLFNLDLALNAGLAALVLSMLALGRTSESLLPLLALFAGGTFRLMPAINRITIALQSLRMGRPIVGDFQADILLDDPIEQTFFAHGCH